MTLHAVCREQSASSSKALCEWLQHDCSSCATVIPRFLHPIEYPLNNSEALRERLRRKCSSDIAAVPLILLLIEQSLDDSIWEVLIALNKETI